MSAHAVDYSRSTRAVCKGPLPCTGSSIPVGSLRYGQITNNEFGETVSWRHWGCVTPDILYALAGIDLNNVIGFKTIRYEDQQKVRRSIAVRHVDLADVPDTAKIALPSALPVGMSSDMPAPTQLPGILVGQKRKRDVAGASQPSSHSSAAYATQALLPDEDEEVIQVESEPADELYCAMKTNIVGVQYYEGLVAPGEQVSLVREPHNPYDRNAIQVKNISGSQVGHIPRNVAAKLAPLLDQRLVTVEGIMHQGNLHGSNYSLSMSLNIYGPSDKRNLLEYMLTWATPGQRGFPQRGGSGAPGPSSVALSYPVGGAFSMYTGSLATAMGLPGSNQGHGTSQAQQEALRTQSEAFARAAELKQMLSGLERVDDENRRATLLDTLCPTVDLLNLPVHPNPPGIVNGELMVDLLKHQSQALQWCIDHEHPKLPSKESDDPVQFWQYRKAGDKAYYFNIATKTPCDISKPPTLGRGALVADSMGLGKTLTMISLVLATKKNVPKEYCNSTLVVAPLSIISNWEKQIDEHCVRGTLTACVYYGPTRNMTPQQLMQYDIVITTYQVVTGDADFNTVAQHEIEGSRPAKKKRSGRGLFGVKWKRIILDEGHTIRNSKTKMAMAISMLVAERRWVLSGTPIINSPKDLGSILSFLRICHPLDDEDYFKRLVLRPLQKGNPDGAELLRALMTHVCIRRTKEMQDSEGNSLVPLPPVDVTLVPVTLSRDARALYDGVELASRQRIESLMKQAGQMNPMVTTNVLSMLTRLRQIALHPGLIPADYLDQLRADEDISVARANAVQITPELKAKLQTVILQAIEDNEECPICFGVVTDPRITSCSHVFCLACISEVITRDPKCPMDRRPLTMQDLVAPPPPTDLTQVPTKQDIDEDDSCAGSSAKIDQLIHLLKLIPSDAKSLVFSQFTSFLDKIGEALEEHGISYVRFDGQLSARRRQEVLERFSIPLEPDECPAPEEQTPVTPVEDDWSAPNGNGSDLIPENASDEDDFEESIMARVQKSKVTEKKRKWKGKAKAVPAKKRVFDGSAFHAENPKVMLISLKAGALGLNLTVANHVFLMDPWWQEGIESQAIDRCNRIGQKKPVHVYQLIAEDTVESKVLEIQEKKKQLIQHAFSGIKHTETQRERREARLQDLVELFGIRKLRA